MDHICMHRLLLHSLLDHRRVEPEVAADEAESAVDVVRQHHHDSLVCTRTSEQRRTVNWRLDAGVSSQSIRRTISLGYVFNQRY